MSFVQHSLSHLGKGLLKLRKLQRLRLDSNQLICVESREFSGLSQLTSLDISHNQLTDITVRMTKTMQESGKWFNLFFSSSDFCLDITSTFTAFQRLN